MDKYLVEMTVSMNAELLEFELVVYSVEMRATLMVDSKVCWLVD